MTEEQLDDWIAQSMNRNINSILNPNKKFFIPVIYLITLYSAILIIITENPLQKVNKILKKPKKI